MQLNTPPVTAESIKKNSYVLTHFLQNITNAAMGEVEELLASIKKKLIKFLNRVARYRTIEVQFADQETAR